MPSPNAASLGRFGDIPVGLYTGSADISIPLFTAQGKTLQLPIGLRYSASGLRVEDIGGWVGMGWALEAGGVITRSVRNVPDEWTNGYYNAGVVFYDPQNWPNPQMNTYACCFQPWPGPSMTFLANIISSTSPQDGEPDQFFFNFAGTSGEFVMGPVTTDVSSRVIRTIPYQDWDIQPTIVGNTITQFVIITENGTKYTFAARETHTDRNTSGGPMYGNPYASSWFLTEIRAVGGDVITLQYQTYDVEHQMGTSGEQHDEKSSDCGTGYQFFTTNQYQMTEQRLSSITTAAHTITFATSLRTDALSPHIYSIPLGAPQEPRLDRITVSTPGGVVLRQFQLSYDYSIGDASNPRLTLKQVAELDRNGQSLPPYTLTYAGPQLPARTSYAVDHWGYYNGKTSNTSYIPPGRAIHTYITGRSGTFYGGADRDPDPSSMQAGTLTRITYPTGGYNEFVYEPHEYSTVYVGGILKDKLPEESQSVTSGVSFPGLRSATFTVGGVDSVWIYVSVFFSSVPQTCPQTCPYAHLFSTAGNLTISRYWYQSKLDSVWVGPNTSFQLDASEEGFGVQVVLGARWRNVVYVNKKIAGGLRVAEVRAADAMGNVSVRKYKYTPWGDPTRSSGMIEAQPRYDYWFSGWVDPYNPTGGPTPLCQFYSRSVLSKMPLGSGSPVVYGEVAVWDGANGEYGKTRHAFLLFDRPPDYTAFGIWPYHRRTSHYWRWGQETRLEYYDASDRLQKQILSSYEFPNDTYTTREFRGMTVTAWPAGPAFTWGVFRVISAWKHLATQTTTVYDTTGTVSFSSGMSYTYGTPNHAQVTEIVETHSDGTQRITRMKYPGDYLTGSADLEAAALTAMRGSAHIHNAVVERSVIMKTGAIEKVMSAELTTFRQTPTGHFLPYQHFVLDNATPIP